MLISLEDRMKQYRRLYEILWFKNPRIKKKEIAAALGVDPRTASRRIEEAMEGSHILGPHVRKRSYANMKEYISFCSAKDPLETYTRLEKDSNISYHAKMTGFANSWIISKERVDISGEILVEAPRSDYYMSYAPDCSWNQALETIRNKIDDFSPLRYNPQCAIRTHWNETAEWDSEDENLLTYFRHNLRKTFIPVMREHLITTAKVYKFLAKLPTCCTVTTSYFPEGISEYDPYLFCFRTEYEDFIIDLFSQIPTSSLFFRVSDRLFVLAHLKKDIVRSNDFKGFQGFQPCLLSLTNKLLKKEIIHSEEHAIIEYHIAKNL
ncbi:MAG: winged helix-turn-helix domain-containing protein [Theionarchaea archaeon]|nr:winged helix-turn-helix domain-containing protein [Theionarchaea archaeon]MBU7035297.1 winged helix-turn-helix domain-containing protein [Theionarchaea archaeon]MBU7039752.1 winged helix-turn-helix domain-containing protein [Theionarchaea archaeon]